MRRPKGRVAAQEARRDEPVGGLATLLDAEGADRQAAFSQAIDLGVRLAAPETFDTGAAVRFNARPDHLPDPWPWSCTRASVAERGTSIRP